MQRELLKSLALSIIFSMCCLFTKAQTHPGLVSEAEQQKVMASINKLLKANYIFPQGCK